MDRRNREISVRNQKEGSIIANKEKKWIDKTDIIANKEKEGIGITKNVYRIW